MIKKILKVLKDEERRHWDIYDEERRHGNKSSQDKTYGAYIATREIRDMVEKMVVKKCL